jgi:hypothetical protein
LHGASAGHEEAPAKAAPTEPPAIVAGKIANEAASAEKTDDVFAPPPPPPLERSGFGNARIAAAADTTQARKGAILPPSCSTLPPPAGKVWLASPFPLHLVEGDPSTKAGALIALTARLGGRVCSVEGSKPLWMIEVPAQRLTELTSVLRGSHVKDLSTLATPPEGVATVRVLVLPAGGAPQ